MQTTIVKWGNSQGIRLPKQLLESVKLSEKDTVEIVAEDNQLIIKKVENEQKYLTIEERFAAFKGVYEPIEIEWGEPKGKEIW